MGWQASDGVTNLVDSGGVWVAKMVPHLLG